MWSENHGMMWPRCQACGVWMDTSHAVCERHKKNLAWHREALRAAPGGNQAGQPAQGGNCGQGQYADHLGGNQAGHPAWGNRGPGQPADHFGGNRAGYPARGDNLGQAQPADLGGNRAGYPAQGANPGQGQPADPGAYDAGQRQAGNHAAWPQEFNIAADDESEAESPRCVEVKDVGTQDGNGLRCLKPRTHKNAETQDGNGLRQSTHKNAETQDGDGLQEASSSASSGSMMRRMGLGPYQHWQ